MRRFLRLLVLVCALVPVVLQLTQYVLKYSGTGKSGRCGQCGMDLSKYEKTLYAIHWTDGTTTIMCGVQCGLTQHILHRDKFKSAIAKDYLDGSAFDAAKGHYVFGSKILPDMAPGFIPFQSLESAEKFRAESGGEVMSFDQALSAWAEGRARR